jgi:hypothetical protein
MEGLVMMGKDVFMKGIPMNSTSLANGFIELVDVGHNMLERIGDCPNFERRVSLKNVLWEDILTCQGWILQRNHISKMARIVDSYGIQKGNGTLPVMQEKMERLLADDFLKPGDVIGAFRGAYEHYGIYVGHNRVIHYAGRGNDFSGEISIHEAPFREFIKNSKSYFVVSFTNEKYPVKIQASTNFIANSIFDCGNETFNTVFSAEETLRRAYSRLGEKEYSLIKNNCEHFAMWCKIGVAKSTQVQQMVKHVVASGIKVGGLPDIRKF